MHFLISGVFTRHQSALPNKFSTLTVLLYLLSTTWFSLSVPICSKLGREREFFDPSSPVFVGPIAQARSMIRRPSVRRLFPAPTEPSRPSLPPTADCTFCQHCRRRHLASRQRRRGAPDGASRALLCPIRPENREGIFSHFGISNLAQILVFL